MTLCFQEDSNISFARNTGKGRCWLTFRNAVRAGLGLIAFNCNILGIILVSSHSARYFSGVTS